MLNETIGLIALGVMFGLAIIITTLVVLYWEGYFDKQKCRKAKKEVGK